MLREQLMSKSVYISPIHSHAPDSNFFIENNSILNKDELSNQREENNKNLSTLANLVKELEIPISLDPLILEEYDYYTVILNHFNSLKDKISYYNNERKSLLKNSKFVYKDFDSIRESNESLEKTVEHLSINNFYVFENLGIQININNKNISSSKNRDTNSPINSEYFLKNNLILEEIDPYSLNIYNTKEVNLKNVDTKNKCLNIISLVLETKIACVDLYSIFRKDLRNGTNLIKEDFKTVHLLKRLAFKNHSWLLLENNYEQHWVLEKEIPKDFLLLMSEDSFKIDEETNHSPKEVCTNTDYQDFNYGKLNNQQMYNRHINSLSIYGKLELRNQQDSNQKNKIIDNLDENNINIDIKKPNNISKVNVFQDLGSIDLEEANNKAQSEKEIKECNYNFQTNEFKLSSNQIVEGKDSQINNHKISELSQENEILKANIQSIKEEIITLKQNYEKVK